MPDKKNKDTAQPRACGKKKESPYVTSEYWKKRSEELLDAIVPPVPPEELPDVSMGCEVEEFTCCMCGRSSLDHEPDCIGRPISPHRGPKKLHVGDKVYEVPGVDFGPGNGDPGISMPTSKPVLGVDYHAQRMRPGTLVGMDFGIPGGDETAYSIHMQKGERIHQFFEKMHNNPQELVADMVVVIQGSVGYNQERCERAARSILSHFFGVEVKG